MQRAEVISGRTSPMGCHPALASKREIRDRPPRTFSSSSRGSITENRPGTRLVRGCLVTPASGDEHTLAPTCSISRKVVPRTGDAASRQPAGDRTNRPGANQGGRHGRGTISYGTGNRSCGGAHCRRRHDNAMPAKRDAGTHHRLPSVAEVREPSVHREFQGTRGAQHTAASCER